MYGFSNLLFFSSLRRHQRGFSLLELLVVVGIITVLLGISLGIYGAIRKKSNLDVDTERLVSTLRLAQNRTLAATNLTNHGVHFDAPLNTYTLFEGAAYNPLSTTNKTIPLDPRVQMLSVQLAGGGLDIIFDRLSGRTSQTGYVHLANRADTSEYRIICVSDSGSVRALGPGQVATACNSPQVEFSTGAINSDLASFPGNSAWGDPAQSFTLGNTSLNTAYVDLYIRKSGTPSPIFLEIRSGSTVGTVLGKSLTISATSIPTTLSWVRFIFPVPVSLTANTQYFLRLRSLPDSTIAFSGGAGTIIWGYEHAASSPPAYSGGDVWRYVGRNNTPTDQGQRLGPSDQYDFSFRIFGSDAPPAIDSRHLEFDLEFSIRNRTNMILNFNNGARIETISIAQYLNPSQTVFNWQGTIMVGSNLEMIRVHSLYIDANDTTLQVHRNREDNDIPLDINLDSTDLVTYTATGTPTKGSTIGSMIYR